MSATDELRRMLDERGVEYEGGKRSVRWRDHNGVMMQAFPLADGELGMDVWSCTPEQAIAATLGSCNCSNNCTKLEVLYRDMSDAEYVKLPKDTGGKYIHEHDKVDWRDHAGTWHENATVVAVCNDGCYVMDCTVFHVHKSDIRHLHAPTVEDVLREFAYGLGVPVADSYVAAAASKLRLAGDAE